LYLFKSNQTADESEKAVELDLIRRGWIVQDPSSRDTTYDMVVETGFREFQTIQVKSVTMGGTFYTTNRGSAKGKEFVSENGKPRHCYSYVDEKIDWMVAYEKETGRIYYYPLSIYSQHDRINIKKVEPKEFPFNDNILTKRPEVISETMTHLGVIF